MRIPTFLATLVTAVALALVIPLPLSSQSPGPDGAFQSLADYVVAGDWTFQGAAIFQGAETHSGNQTFTGNITSSGTNTWSGTNTFSSAVNTTGLLTPTGGVLGTSPTNPLGYAAGAGCAVTQITSITTGVTCTGLTGTITTVAMTLAAGVDATFTVTNTSVTALDTVVMHTRTYGGTADGIPITNVQEVAAGSFDVNIRNTGAVALDALATLQFAVLRGAAS